MLATNDVSPVENGVKF